jgi:hypothetical protein
MNNNGLYDDGIQVTFDENFTGKVTGKVEYGHASRVTDENWQEKASLVIKAGEFDIEYANGSADALNGANIKISGGSFLYEVPEAYCAEGYVPVELENGRYSVQTKEEAGIFELIDGEEYTRTENVKATKVTYTRTFPNPVKDHYQVWYVPFDYTISSTDTEKGTYFYKIHVISASESQGDGTVVDQNAIWLHIQPMQEGDVLQANRPYIVKTSTTGEPYVFTSENVTLYSKNEKSRLHVASSIFDFNVYGTYVSNTKPSETPKTWLSLNGSGNLFWNKETSKLASSYRWYIMVTTNEENDGYARPNIYIVEDDGDTDGINNAQTAEGEIQGIYTLGGMKVEHPVKGVNIIKYTDGRTKKIYVK